MRTIRLTLYGLVSLGLAAGMGAQVIKCPDKDGKPGSCTATIVAGQSQEIAVLVTSPEGERLMGVTVSFEQSRGTLHPLSATTDAKGIATTTWLGSAGSQDDPVSIKIVAKNADWSTTATYALKMPAENALRVSKKGDGGRDSGDEQSWYVGRELRGPVSVAISGVTPAECSKTMVAFKASGDGVAIPDSVPAQWEKNQCVADARWKLGSVVGDQYMAAHVRGSDQPPPPLFHAKARNTPWLAAGLAWTYVTGYTRLSTTTQQLQIVTGSAAAETTQTIPVKKASVQTTAAASAFAPTLGVNTPIMTSLPWLRASLSADVQNVSTDWFAGVSIPQLWDNIYNEDIGVDLQLVMHISRRDVVTNASDCSANQASCSIKTKTRPVGVGLIAQVNAGSLLTAIMSFFPKG
jgi:hypothetical protein